MGKTLERIALIGVLGGMLLSAVSFIDGFYSLKKREECRKNKKIEMMQVYDRRLRDKDNLALGGVCVIAGSVLYAASIAEKQKPNIY